MPASVQLGPHRDLEDAEVAILHEIVSKAAAAPDVQTYPFRSLHSAYLDVLDRHGISETSDSIYLRFLFQLRERHQPGRPLDDAFQDLLLDHGIQIYPAGGSSSIGGDEYSQAGVNGLGYDDEGQESPTGVDDRERPGDVTIALERFGRPVEDLARAAQQWIPTPRRSRRASFESIYDRGDKAYRAGPARRRPDSRASFSQVAEETGKISPGPGFEFELANGQRQHPPRPWEASMIANAPDSSPIRSFKSTRPQSQITLLEPEENLLSPLTSLSPVLNVDGLNRGRASDTHYPYGGLPLRTSQAKPQPIKERHVDPPRWFPQIYHNAINTALDPAANLPLVMQKFVGKDELPRQEARSHQEFLRRPLSPMQTSLPQQVFEHHHGPTDYRLIAKAQDFEAEHLRSLLQKVIHHWLERTYHVVKHQEDLEHRAIRWDARLLKKDTIKVWYDSMMDIREARASMRARDLFYEQQERNAADLRDKMLLRKALLHWAQCAAEETERASLARQHLTRFRYFQAWREHTVATEIKVSRHVLGKWFKKWQRPGIKQQRNSALVVGYYEDTVIKRLFLHWLWQVREIRIQRQRDNLVKQKVFSELFQRFGDIRESQQLVTQARQRAALQSLQKQAQDHTRLQQMAEMFNRERLLRAPLAAISREQRLSGVFRTVCSMADSRLGRFAFGRLRRQSQLEQAARNFDRQRLLRNTASAWNDRLREESIVKRVNDRVVTHFLYRWALAERGRLFERLHKERLLNRCLVKVVDHWMQQSQGLTQAYVTFKRRQKERALRSVMQTWWSKTRNHLRHEAAAVARDEQRLKGTAIDTFGERLETVRKLGEEYLPNAVLWFKGRTALRQWQHVTKESRKRKRHDAYAAVRRKVKQNMARRCLDKWRERTKAVERLNDEDSETRASFKQQSLHTLKASLFHEWRDKLREAQQREAAAARKRDGRLAGQAIATWVARSRTAADRLAVALERDSEHGRRAAYRSLRTLHFRIRRIQDLGAADGPVADFARWSRRRHDRALLRLWAEKTLRRRGRADIDIPATARTRRFRGLLLGQSQLRDNGSRASMMMTTTAAAGPSPLLPLDLDDEQQNQNQQNQQPSMTPALPPPPSTPSRRRYARFARTPAPAVPGSSSSSMIPVARGPAVAASSSSLALTAAASSSVDKASKKPADNPFVSAEAPATDSRVRQSRAFGRSTARTLFGRIQERAPDSHL